jgi:hypothetical protein
MDPTLIAGLIGAIATLVAAILPPVVNRVRRDRGTLRGTIDQLVVPLGRSRARDAHKEKLSRAKTVRMCGWALFRTIDKRRHRLREAVQRGCDLRILMLDPKSSTVDVLDSIITSTDPLARRAQGWPEVVPKQVTRRDLLRTIEILKENDIVKKGTQSETTLRVCNSLLPFGLTMVEYDDGSGWLSLQIYPLHPDFAIEKRLGFILSNNRTELWQTLKEQFDAAWDDPSFSYPLEGWDGYR